MNESPRLILSVAVGRTSRTERLFTGAVSSLLCRLELASMPNISRAFAPMVQEGRYDVSEMAIATFLMAKAAGKPLVLLPVVLAARLQEAALLCRADSVIAGPTDLIGRRVGVRSYSQTTGLWLRGRLCEEYGIKPEAVCWVTFEDAHLAEYRDPSWTERAATDTALLTMLRRGELDAAIFGNDVPADPALRTVFRDPAAAGTTFLQAHGFVPVNHIAVARADIAREHPEVVIELLRLFQASGAEVPGRAGLAAAITLANRYAVEQALLPRPLSPEEVWAGTPADIG